MDYGGFIVMGRYSISTTFTLSVKLTELLNLYVKLIRYLTRCLKQHVNVRYTLFLRYVKENNNCKINKNLDYYIYWVLPHSLGDEIKGIWYQWSRL